MSRYFLGSVGIAEAFYIRKGIKRLAFAARTLTENSINITSTVDDLRAGTGATSMAVFSHDPSIEVKMVDILWNSAYVEICRRRKYYRLSKRDSIFYKCLSIDLFIKRAFEFTFFNL